jgi:hypothetical protein
MTSATVDPHESNRARHTDPRAYAHGVQELLQ